MSPRKGRASTRLWLLVVGWLLVVYLHKSWEMTSAAQLASLNPKSVNDACSASVTEGPVIMLCNRGVDSRRYIVLIG